MSKTMFELVSVMNEAFGNPKGDPNLINGNKLLSQCKNIPKETQELFKAFGFEFKFEIKAIEGHQSSSIDDIRDALCDQMVFILGAYHLMGFDADRDMASVVEALYTRFCRHEGHFKETASHYRAIGVDFTVHGEFPTVCLKSAKDQGDGEYPKGKFLKAVGYSKPVFYQPEPPPVVEIVKPPERNFIGMQAHEIIEDMAEQRQAFEVADLKMRTLIDKLVAKFRADLEREAFGFEPFDLNDNTISNSFNPSKAI